MLMEEKLEWSRWSVPYGLIKTYIILMLCVLFLFPNIVGLQLTLLGYVINYLWADFMFYVWYKAKLRAQKEWEKRQKIREWRDDNDESNRME